PPQPKGLGLTDGGGTAGSGSDAIGIGFLINPRVTRLANGFDATGEGPAIAHAALPSDKQVVYNYAVKVRFGDPKKLAVDLGKAMADNHFVFVMGHFFTRDARLAADDAKAGASEIYGPALEAFAAGPVTVKYGMTFFLGCGSEALEDLVIKYQTKVGRA